MGGGPEGFRTVAYYVNWYEATLDHTCPSTNVISGPSTPGSIVPKIFP